MTYPVSAEMKQIINARCADIEAQHEIKIVYACESGSRAWGFPSADSDYDVRFIYVRSLAWYLSIDEGRDVIEYPINAQLDINGWDIKKALHLIRKTNPPLLEWLGSPIIYYQTSMIAEQLRQLSKAYYSPTACLYHYHSMARGNFREYLHGDTVRLKKYVYVLRPLLAMRWIEEDRGIVPTDFTVVLDQLELDTELKAAIRQLVEHKRAGFERDQGPPIPVIGQFIESELARWEYVAPPKPIHSTNLASLDLAFRASIQEVWSLANVF